jgi:hypothetical protein
MYVHIGMYTIGKKSYNNGLVEAISVSKHQIQGWCTLIATTFWVNNVFFLKILLYTLSDSISWPVCSEAETIPLDHAVIASVKVFFVYKYSTIHFHFLKTRWRCSCIERKVTTLQSKHRSNWNPKIIDAIVSVSDQMLYLNRVLFLTTWLCPQGWSLPL